MKRFYFTVFVLFIIGSYSIQAQDILKEGEEIELITKDGNRFIGTVTAFTDEIISIESSSIGNITLQRSDVEKVSLVDSDFNVGEGNIAPDIYNSTTYLVSPSGYTLKKGQSFYQNIYLFFNSYTYGFSDNFSLSGGLELLTPLVGEGFPGFFISPKYSIPFKNGKGAFSVGATSLFIFVDDPTVVGVAQGAVTFGGRNDNFTIGTGLGFTSEDGFSDFGGTIPINLSGMTRIGKSLSFVSDNFLFLFDGGSFGVLSAALRVHLGSAAANFGIFRSTEDQGGIFGIPFVSVTIPIK